MLEDLVRQLHLGGAPAGHEPGVPAQPADARDAVVHRTLEVVQQRLCAACSTFIQLFIFSFIQLTSAAAAGGGGGGDVGGGGGGRERGREEEEEAVAVARGVGGAFFTSSGEGERGGGAKSVRGLNTYGLTLYPLFF